MTSTLRRRLPHGDVDGNLREHFNASGLDEPLLGDRDKDKGLTLEEIWEAERRKERFHWGLIFSRLIAQWSLWLGSESLVGRFLPLSFASQNGSSRKLFQPSLSPLQEERLGCLQRRLGVPFDTSSVEHQNELKKLWRLAYPDRELPSLKSELWKEMGWQGSDPSTDFRGGGFVSLENLIFFAEKYPDSFQRLMHKKEGIRAEWEYPFAVAGVNISFMLVQILDLQTGKPSTVAGIRFLELLAQDEMAFDNLYCVAFEMMDAQWLAKRASYMEFNDVLKSTRAQLERELALDDVCSIRDLPAYNMLRV